MENLKKVFFLVTVVVLCLVVGGIFIFDYYEKQTYLTCIDLIILSNDTLINDYNKISKEKGISWEDYFSKMKKLVNDAENIRDKLIAIKTPKAYQLTHHQLIELICLERDVIEKKLSCVKFIFETEINIQKALKWKEYALEYNDYKDFNEAVENARKSNNSEKQSLDELENLYKKYLEQYEKLKLTYKIALIEN